MNKLLIIFLNVLALFAVGVMFWFLNGEVSAERLVKLKLAELDHQTSRLEENKALLSQVSADRDKVAAYFVDNRSLPTLIESLETMAVADGVDLDLNQAVVENQKEASAKLRLDLVVTGSFPAVTNYLARLEAMPYELVFSNLRLSQEGVNEKVPGWRLQTSVELLSYYHDEI